jgi:N-acetylglucosamine-6-phosphate deacetylase
MEMKDVAAKIKGFIDLHTHGIGRYDTRTAKPEDVLKMAELHGKAGVAAILPTIYSGPIDVMRKNMEAVRKAMQVQSSPPFISPLSKGGIRGVTKLQTPNITHHSSLILGVHLEGPFLNPVRCGALDKDSFIKPTLSSLKELISGYEDIIKIITIAPEIPGALRVIERCTKLRIKVNMGHSDATYKQALDGKEAGATGITHIFNAMRPFHQREPGLIGLALLDEDLYVEVIADGIHLHPETLKFIFAIKRLDRIILVSDAVKGADKHTAFSVQRLALQKGIISGSKITISGAAKVLRKIGIPKAEIIEAGVDNPKRYLGLA